MADDPEPSPEELAAREQRRIAEGQVVTARVSENARYIGFGLMVAYFAIRTGQSPFTERLSADHPIILAVIALCGALAILMDYIQYWAGAVSNEDARRRETRDYDTTLRAYKLRVRAFSWKQLPAVVGSVLLVGIFTYDTIVELTAAAPLPAS